jgi:hypothetical protein
LYTFLNYIQAILLQTKDDDDDRKWENKSSENEIRRFLHVLTHYWVKSLTRSLFENNNNKKVKWAREKGWFKCGWEHIFLFLFNTCLRSVASHSIVFYFSILSSIFLRYADMTWKFSRLISFRVRKEFYFISFVNDTRQCELISI